MSDMAKYFAAQIHAGKLDYHRVVTAYPKLKNDIDEILRQYEAIPTVEE